jgi:hypothetical protein
MRTRARRCVPVSDSEFLTAPNLHEMSSGLSHFFAFGLVAQCNFVHRPQPTSLAGQPANVHVRGCPSPA